MFLHDIQSVMSGILFLSVSSIQPKWSQAVEGVAYKNNSQVCKLIVKMWGSLQK